MKNSEEAEDLSHRFFSLCNELKDGELVYTDEFRLQDAMASVELMDPKMDIGMQRLPKGMGLSKAIDEGLYERDLGKQIATMDATFTMLVAWLEGNSLAQTVWTNVMLAEAHEVTDEIYATFCNGIIHLVQIISNVVQASCTFEEEDFNASVPFAISSSAPREFVVRELRRLVSLMASSATNYSLAEKKREQLLAIGTRLEFTFMFIEVLALLTPPGKPVPEKTVKDDDDDNTDEDEMEIVDEEEPPPFKFQPKFSIALCTSRALYSIAQATFKTIGMGTAAPETGDGDFRWLPAFEPDLNRRYLPATFPRKVIIPERKTALEWLVKMADRMQVIASFAESSANDLSSLFYFARNFNFDQSCVLSRSVLQLAMFPVDEHIFGNPEHTIAEPIEASLRDMFAPLLLERAFPVYHDILCQKLYNRFMTQMSRTALTVYQLFGCNMARQRDRLVQVMRDFDKIQEFANHVEKRTDQVMMENKVTDMSVVPHHSVTTFVFHNLLALVSHYFELSLRMDLFVPYEFCYVYWYLGDILSRWQISTLERAQEMMMQGWKNNPLSTTVNPRKSKEKAKGEEMLKKKLQMNQFQMIQQFGLCQLCDGIVKITLAMINLQKIKVPTWADDSEKLRYDNRMAPLEMLGNPLYINYQQYRNLSRMNELELCSVKQLVDQAIENFEVAKTHLSRLENRPEKTKDCITHLKITKANLVGAKIMNTDDMDDRKIEWVFNMSPIYPQLSITKVSKQ